MTGTTDWKSWIADYFRAPEDAWGNPNERQVTKLNSVLAQARSNHGLDTEGLIEVLLHAVDGRDPTVQSAVYLENLGGCGSHWISRMMAEATGLADAGEVYLPPAAYSSFLQHPLESARILDAIEMAHGLLYGLSPGHFASARMINSAHGCEKIAFYRKLRPRSRIVHLIRDPRDRTLSVSFRKEEFRNYEAPHLADFEYMLSKAQRSLSYWRRYSGLRRKADVEIRYEDFRRDSATHLCRLLKGIGIDVAPALARAVAYRNSPEFLRSPEGRSHRRGNLDQGGIAHSWQETEALLARTMHSVMAPAIVGQGYRLCDCFPGTGHDLSLTEFSPEATLVFEALSSEHRALLDVRYPGESTWHLIGAGPVAIPAGSRLRMRWSDDGRGIATLEKVSRWISDFCAAGNSALDDQALSALGVMPKLTSLDLALTSVRRPPVRSQFPALRWINLSGTPCSSTAGNFDGLDVVRDY